MLCDRLRTLTVTFLLTQFQIVPHYLKVTGLKPAHNVQKDALSKEEDSKCSDAPVLVLQSWVDVRLKTADKVVNLAENVHGYVGDVAAHGHLPGH